MNRRSYLAVVGGALTLAGCAGSQPTQQANPASQPTEQQPRSTPSPTPTETPTPRPPVIQTAGPVYRWRDFGDAVTNRVESVGKGAILPIAARYDIWIHDGTFAVTKQIRAYDESGHRVGLESASSEQLTEGNGYDTWEGWISFNTQGWGEGHYTGEMLIRDDATGKTSDAADWEVDIVPPLTNGEVSLSSIDVPGTVTAGEPFSWSITIRNETDRDSSIVSPISVRQDGGEWLGLDDTFRLNIPAQRAVTRSSEGASVSEAGEFEYRLDDCGLTWSFAVKP